MDFELIGNQLRLILVICVMASVASIMTSTEIQRSRVVAEQVDVVR